MGVVSLAAIQNQATSTREPLPVAGEGWWCFRDPAGAVLPITNPPGSAEATPPSK